MAISEITMPRLSDSMEEGTILTWLVAGGEPVAEGDELVEIETDKATMTHPAEASGVLEVLVAEGETVPVGTPIARIGEGSAAAPAKGAEAAPAKQPLADPSGNGGNERREPIVGAATGEGVLAEPPARSADRGPLATPLARRIASSNSVELAGIEGSGPRGRITQADVLAAAGLAFPPAPTPRARSRPEATSAATQEPAGARGETRIEELTRVQAAIARRMTESKATVPHFQVQVEVAMDAAVELRAGVKEVADPEMPSFNDMVVKAAALALRNHPRANASFRDGAFHLHERINIGVAVATEGALLVPTIMDADVKSLGQIALETRSLAERVRTGEVTPPELEGGTFTVSNLGMFGMTAITPVVNPPEAAILGVGALRDVLKRGESGEILDASMMTLTLSCDHRILYGADAARFLAEIQRLLEVPLRLFL